MSVKTDSAKLKSNIWNYFAIALLLVATLSWRLIDAVFVIAFLTIMYQEWRYYAWSGIKALLSKTKLVTCLICGWLGATTLGYFLTVQVGPVQIEEILGLRWIFSLYIAIYIGSRLSFEEKAFKATMLAMAALLLLGIPWQYLILEKMGRYEGTFGNANIYSTAVVLPWAFALAWESFQFKLERKYNYWLISVILILGGLIFFTYSRGTWLSMALAFLAVTLFLGLKRNILFLAGSLIACLFAFQANLFNIKERILYSFDLSSGSSQGIRINLWKTNYAILMDHPIFGVGFYENLRLLPIYYEKLGIDNRAGDEVFIGHAHNQFLQILVGSGIVGFFCWASVFVVGGVFFYRAFKKSKDAFTNKVGFSALLVLIAFLANCWVESPFMLSYTRGFLFMLIGFSAGFLMKAVLANVEPKVVKES